MTRAIVHRDKWVFDALQEKYSKDFKWALGLNQLGAQILGVWPSGEQRKKPEPWHMRIRAPFMMSLLFFWICLPQTWALLLVIDDLSLVINNLVSNSAASGGCIKLFFLWRSKQTMRPVITSIRNDWLSERSAWKRKLMLDNALGMRLVTIVDYAATVLSLIGFSAFPLLNIDIRLFNNITDYGDRHLLVQSYYPFDYSKSPYFEVTQALQYMGSLFAALVITVPDNYFGALVMHVSGQFEILGLELERLFRDDDPISTSMTNRRCLAGLIHRHVHLIAVVKALDNSFTFVTFGHILMTSVILCSYGFQVLAIVGGNDEPVSALQMIALLVIMSTMLVHTLVDCAVGEALRMRSTSLTDSIYRCHWYAVDGKHARDLIPMMISSRIQKPLNACKILPLSLATYCAILRTTAGYISVLIAVNAK